MNETIATEAAVENAVAQLEAAGEPISVRRLRQEIGGGSLKTIADMLRTLTEKKRQAAEIARERSEIPMSVTEAMDMLKLQVWRAAQAETQALIDAIEQRRANEMATNQAERERQRQPRALGPRLQHPQLCLGDLGPDRLRPQLALHRAPPMLSCERDARRREPHSASKNGAWLIRPPDTLPALKPAC